ncbi:MAG: rhamnulokinase [Planctomycetaceae bacterium]|jgi:rhamnulokinase|nr:rhamnulokinase [Planctomycetaceae bacterium]
MAVQVYLAVDIGASSGRLVAGEFDGTRISLEEVYRFNNGGVSVGRYVHWDVLEQWSHIKRALQQAVDRYGNTITSVGVDTWGVDFGLLGPNDELLANPIHYRDNHTEGMMEYAFEQVSRSEIFNQSGLQFMRFNTLYQLLALQNVKSPLLDAAESMLLMPDLFHWLLTGEKANEYTNATTTQFYNPQKKRWATELFDSFSLPQKLLGQVVPPGTELGPLHDDISRELGGAKFKVVLPGTHDTASAVMAVPAVGELSDKPNWCYISSGTWSLMGVEIANPIISAECQEMNFTNEGGIGDSIRLLKNIAGLWLVQECRRIFNTEGQSYGWDELVEIATAAAPLVSLIDPDDECFLAPESMPDAIRDYCRKTGQTVPGTDGAVIRCALESLALRYQMVLQMLERLTGGAIKTVHIVGGGIQNRLLCQLTANACDRSVVTGPIEATAIGNLMVQLISSGVVSSMGEARKIISHSFGQETYVPDRSGDWVSASERFANLVNA